MQAHERFLHYIQIDTASDENSQVSPTTPGQRKLGEMLVEELRELGVQDARIDKDGYVYASIPENAPGQPVIGLVAHLDTVNCVPVMPMNARIVHYTGGDIVLNESGEKLSPEQYPSLDRYVGGRLIVTDGRTLLGADDKAGVAEIMTLCERLMADPSIPHGRVAVCFTPDEEVGRGADRFDVTGFGADFAFTLDGGELGHIEFENFNACSGTVTVHGVSIHPGSAKNKLKNAGLMATRFAQLLPAAETPEHTEGYEGFFHLTDIAGDEENACLKYIIRDHDASRYEKRKQQFSAAAAYLNQLYGEGTFEVRLEESYRNMREKLEDKMDIIERAKKAMQDSGVTPVIEPIRGGTDGARLSFMGLPCPNLSTGGMNYHGRHECASVESMETMVEVLTQLVRAR